MEVKSNVLRPLWFKQFFLENILIFLFGYDFLVKTLLVSFDDLVFFYNYAIIYKALIVSLAIYFLRETPLNRELLIPILGLLTCFIFVQLQYFPYMETKDILFNGYYFLNSIFPILFLMFFYKFKKLEVVNRQIKNFLWFVVLNSSFILVGYFSDIELFSTYFRGSERLGSQGLLLYHSESGYIYFLGLNLMYLSFLKKRDYLNGLILFFLFCSSLLIGTKKAFFLSIIFLLLFVLKHFRKANFKTTVIFLVSILAVIKVYSIALQKHFLLFFNIYEKEGFLSSFTSYRNSLFEENFIPYISNASATNMIFGGPYMRSIRVELELFDLIMFFGAFGVACYIMIFKTLLKSKGPMTWYIVGAVLLAGLFSGNLLSSLNVMILLIITLKYINLNRNEKEKSSNIDIIL